MRSQFLTNYSDITFLDKIKENLKTCKEFYFSVSFIKKAGLVLLIKDIEDALNRGAKGKLITSTYQNFTDIESLRTFSSLMNKYSNFSCHLDFNSLDGNYKSNRSSLNDSARNYETIGYHSKGYLFVFDNHCEIIIGSSNITRHALLKNIEWDLVIEENINSNTYLKVYEEFNDLWNKTYNLDKDIINKYSVKLDYSIERWDMDYDFENMDIKPNYMQKKALKELIRYRAMGVNRALVVASAASGKTYLSAFDAFNFNPQRLLYIVHEESILRKSLETFQSVFKGEVTYGIYSGTNKDIDAQFVFATNISMSKSLELFSKKEFDYIIVDECHHATAKTYKKIINYFEPEFLLGLTATPERMDNQDVFELFDKNVPYELRLKDAIMNDLVVPFHYYGIRDTLVNYGLSKDEESRLISQLGQEEHCQFIHENIEKYRVKGKLKALAFCRNVSHARIMAENMANYYKTAYLTGKNDIGERIRAYNDLQDDNKDLEILFTVDILNEGVDIPGINMVLFLRPTESSTIFIQQLGRGLRKYPNKEYVTILDFIGNSYKRSVQIAFALSSLSDNFILEKKLMTSLVQNNFSALGLEDYGVKINIDNLSKEEITNFLDKENFNSLSYLKQDYFNFKKYINAEFYPRHMDYLNNDCAPDILRFLNISIKGKKNCSYYNFLKGIDEENLPTFTSRQVEFINYLSNMLPLVRKHEYIIFKCLIDDKLSDLNEIYKVCVNEIKEMNEEQFNHALKYMEKDEFVKIKNNHLYLDVSIDKELKEYIDDLLTYGLTRYFCENKEDPNFRLWGSYRMDQVQLKLLKNPKFNIKGTYVYDGVVIIFASIKKNESIEEHLKYKDKFINPSLFQWESEVGLSLKEKDDLINSKKALLFIRKMKSENGIVLPFTYVGEGKLTNPRKSDNPKDSLLFDIVLEKELIDYLQYDFGLKDK